MEEVRIVYKINSRSKSLSIKILTDNSIVITRPVGVSLKRAEQFFEKNKALIFERIKSKPRVCFELDKIYYSKFHEIKITRSLNDKNAQRILNQRLLVKIKLTENINSIESQDYIKLAIQKLLKIEARSYLPKRVFELAESKGLKYNNLKINSAKTRWGSCNYKNDINLSCFLMVLPYHLIDYVILHELSHTIHKNHSSNFYELLDKLVGGQHLRYNSELKKKSLGIHPLYFQKAIF